MSKIETLVMPMVAPFARILKFNIYLYASIGAFSPIKNMNNTKLLVTLWKPLVFFHCQTHSQLMKDAGNSCQIYVATRRLMSLFAVIVTAIFRMNFFAENVTYPIQLILTVILNVILSHVSMTIAIA